MLFIVITYFRCHPEPRGEVEGEEGDEELATKVVVRVHPLLAEVTTQVKVTNTVEEGEAGDEAEGEAGDEAEVWNEKRWWKRQRWCKRWSSEAQRRRCCTSEAPAGGSHRGDGGKVSTHNAVFCYHYELHYFIPQHANK